MRNIQVRNTSTLHSHLVPYISCKQTAKLPVIASYIYYIKLKSCLSVCPTVMPVSQPYQHGLKRDLLKMKAESSGTTKYIYKSLHVPLLIHMSVLNALVQAKTAIKPLNA